MITSHSPLTCSVDISTRKTRPARFALLLAAALDIGLVGSAMAQTASQLTEGSYAPPVIRAVGGGIELPAVVGLAAPAGAERLHVTPSGLVVENALPDLAEATAAVEARLKGKRVSGADLFVIAQDLETAYVRAGFLLARVSLPPQTLKDGMPLKLVVTDGYVAAIDVSALPEAVRGRVASILKPLEGRSGLKKAELERRMLLAGDTPGLSLRSTLRAGGAPGATIIVIEGAYAPVSGTIDLDNSLSKEMGRYSLNLGVDVNGVLGLGETTYVRLSGYPGAGDQSIFGDDPRNRQIVAGFTLPLGTDGVWLNVEGVDSKTHPTSDLGYTMVDDYQRLSTRLGYGWLRSRSANASTLIGLDVANESQKIDFAGTRSDFSEDRLRVLRLTQTGDIILDDGSRLSGNGVFSVGLDALGARQATAALPLSRDGAEPDFRKFELSLSYAQGFAGDRVQLSVAARAQTSFGDPLAASEQMSITGMDWVSGFNSGEIQADAGAVMRTELAFPVALPALELYPGLGSVVSPYLFAAGGIARLEKASAVEDEITRAGAFGAGMRLALSEKASPRSSTLSLEYAHGTASGRKTEDRFNLRFQVGF
ncbi:ShlB/FhaC/HecB family hemolysin secretion/activation protein [Rhizobium sp. CSW-27]|uniref:ShlB/FhaC/HecB family hemolysin secretion/activation protein n=1 Tax=Rhizobium sp. CSW-27 TaxID=2839985 RepID=UPI001C00E138|nr:ShlB/FhaC/HecB family hemolysin secretion/activation protein [Rhizobium sp. CSW-27]MBT9371276.1 ShlB/FhaC/HecB family hemolysin secretion/activation protein [Rhizobium sp. CSW-27]